MARKVTGQIIGPSDLVWGNVSGEISNQSDLNRLISSKVSDVESKISSESYSRISKDEALEKTINDIKSELIPQSDVATKRWVKDQNYVLKEDIPIKTSQLYNDSGFLTEHQSLEDYSKLKESATNVEMSLDDSTSTLTANLYNKLGELISSSEAIELPLDSLVSNVSYDDESKRLLITFKNGEIHNVSISSIIKGLVSEDDLVSKLLLKVDKEDGKSLLSDSEISRLATLYNYDDTEVKDSLEHKVDKIEGYSLMSSEEHFKLSGIEENANNYILPSDVVKDSSYVHTDNNFTDRYKQNIEDNNKKISNVRADWNAIEGEAVILNKPSNLGVVDDVIVNNKSVIKNRIAEISVPTKVSDINNDLQFVSINYHDDSKQNTISDLASIREGANLGRTALQSFTETDPTVPSWAKASNKPTYTAEEVGAISYSLKGYAGGVAELDEGGKVPSSQLPSFVDDVLEYATKASFPKLGETGKIYVDISSNLTYRWSGNSYVEIGMSIALGETSSTAYPGNKGKANADAISTHIGNGNIHVTSANKTAWNAKYDKPSGGIPKTDLASAVRTSLGKADTALQSFTETDPVFSASAAAGIKSADITNWNNKTSNVGTVTSVAVKMNNTTKGTITSNGTIDLGTVITAHQNISGKQDVISDLATIRSGAALGATALQSFTETDPVFSASAASKIKTSDISNWNSKTSNVGTVTSVSVKANGQTKGTVTTSGTIDLGNLGNISSSEVTSIKALTQEEYDNLPTKSETVLYVIYTKES